MKPTRRTSKQKSNTDTQLLQQLAMNLDKSASIVEDHWWQKKLFTLIDGMLLAGQENELTNALDTLTEADSRAQAALVDSIEAATETIEFEINGKPYISLLITAPILAWSRYAVPSSSLSDEVLTPLKTQFAAHVLANDVQLTLANFLFSPDQLPRSFCDTRELLNTLTESAQAGKSLNIDTSTLPETNRFLADIRYLVGCVTAPKDNPIFRWQEPDGDRTSALTQWQQQGLPNLSGVMSSCAVEGLLANAYHAACRDADRAIRPYSLTASVLLLQALLNLEPAQLQATVCPCFDKELVEYRVGFGPIGSLNVFHGMVWPALDEEDDFGNSDVQAEMEAAIEATIRNTGITDIEFLTQQFPIEFCEDCGAPFYPNREGELVHVEMPEPEQHSNFTLH
jgi:Protein of unknown function (DUF2863)